MNSQVVPDFVWLAGNVTIAAILLSLVGLLASRGLARLKPSSGHWGLVSICLLLLVLPLVHLVSQASDVAWWKFESSFLGPAEFDQFAPNAMAGTTITPLQINTFVYVCKFVVLIWLFGAAVAAFRSAAEVIRLRRWIRMTKRCEDTATIELVAHAAQLVGIRIPEVRVTTVDVCPMVVGFWNPKLVLSMQFLSHESSMGMLGILVHECEHIRRRDNFWNLLCRFGIVVYWWNPFLRRLVQEMDRMCECACDDRAIEATGTLREYAIALVEIARNQTGEQLGLMCQSLLGGRPDLPSRIERLRDPSRTGIPSRSPWLVIALMTMLTMPFVIPIGLPTIGESLKLVDVAESQSKDGMVYLSMNASDSNVAETLSRVLCQRQNEGNQFIVDLRHSSQQDPAISVAQLGLVGKSVGQGNRSENVSPVSVVMIVSDESDLSKRTRDLIAASGNSVQILNANSTSSTNGAAHRISLGNPLSNQASFEDPYLTWAVRILKHA